MSVDGSKGVQAGHGRLVLLRSHDKASFETCSFRYPLKLMLPKAPSSLPLLGASYILGYGGGLVSGDRIELDVDVGPSCTLLLLTQGSTKVFKPVSETSDPSIDAQRQYLRANVAADATLVLLPSHVTCFARASYSQVQQINLVDNSASLILFDWLTSGRRARGEHWQFARYRSELVVRIADRVLAHDTLLLEGADYPSRVDPYSCYATLLLVGPTAAPARRHFAEAFDVIRQPARRKQQGPDELLWAYSSIGVSDGIVRVAGMTTELVRDFLRDGLRSVEAVVGGDLYASAWA